MKLNLKNVQSLFRKGIKLGQFVPAAPISRVRLQVLDKNGKVHVVGAISRDMWLDLQPRELKRVVTNMRDRATSLDPNRDHSYVHCEFTGNMQSSLGFFIDVD